MNLIHNTTTVWLPDGADWKDRYSWSPVIRKEDYGCGDGAPAPLIVDEFLLATGRPITLDWAFLQREQLAQLAALAAIPAATLTWQWTGEPDRTVTFRGSDPIQARQLILLTPAQDDDFFSVTVNLIEVS